MADPTARISAGSRRNALLASQVLRAHRAQRQEADRSLQAALARSDGQGARSPLATGRSSGER